MQSNRYGFRILGALHGERRPIDWLDAFTAYASCDPRAEVHKEAYLSAFTFGDAFHEYLKSTGSTKGYVGGCSAKLISFDIDRDEITDALSDSRKLVSTIANRYGLDELLIFFSGRKGFHIGLPTSLLNCQQWLPERFNQYAKALAVGLATVANVEIDVSVYDKVRAFRAPNSRHPKTGLHKRILTTDELLNLKAERIVELSRSPEPFDIPDDPSQCNAAVDDWKAAVASVDALASVAKAKRESGDPKTALNRATMNFIREGATVGNRHPELFKAAANLSEFGCTYELAYAVLSEAALDSGLPPSEVRRQIELGLKHQSKGSKE